MKNYYKILEIDKDASPEIIKVAYKLLVKKYHPDLKKGTDKKTSEERIKEINEAYDVLSNPEKKSQYDESLSKEIFSQEQYSLVLNENENLKRELNHFKGLYYKHNPQNSHSKVQRSNMYNSENSSNSNDSSNIFNKIKNIFNSLDDTLKTIIILLFIFLILYIIFSIPFLKKFLFSVLDDGYLIIFILVIVFYIYYFKNKK